MLWSWDMWFATPLLLTFLFASPLLAADKKKKENPGDEIGNMRVEGIDVVQGRVFRKGLRHEFTVEGGYIPNDDFLYYELGTFRYTFHFREALAFEASYYRAFNQEKDIVDDLENIPCPAGGFFDANSDGIQDSKCGVELKTASGEGLDPIKNMFFGNVVWSPIYGKFSIFSKKILHFDIYLTAGAGYVDKEDSNEFGFNVGAGWKIFLNDWAAVRLDIRNITVREEKPFDQVANNQVYSLGFSMFLPPKPYPIWKKGR